MARSAPEVMPALVTPFDADGSLDLAAHRHNVATLWKRGARGFLLGGSSGEGPYLEPGERASLVAAARGVVPDAYLLGGVNGESVRLATIQLDEVATAGADACLVITPTTLSRDDDAAVRRFYEAIADISPLPVLLYTVPRWTGYALPVDVATALAAHAGVVGIKDSGGDPARIGELVTSLHGAPFLVYAGASGAVAASVRLGATGAITASGNYAYELVASVVASVRTGSDPSSAQARLSAITSAVERWGLAGTKAAAAAAGLDPGWPRLPLRPLPDDVAAELAAVLG